MTNPKARLERYKLFLNDPLIRKDVHHPSPLSLQATLSHIMKPEKTRGSLQNSTITRMDSNVSKREFQRAFHNIEDFHKKIIQLENTTANLRKGLEQNLSIIGADDRKMDSVSQALNRCFQDSAPFYNKIGMLREDLLEVMSSLGIINKMGEDRIDHSKRYGGPREDEKLFFNIEESPIKFNSSLVLDPSDVLKMKNMNESDKIKSLRLENEKLEEENKALVNRIDFYNQQREGYNAQMQAVQNEAQLLQEKLEGQIGMIRKLEAENNSLNSRLRQAERGSTMQRMDSGQKMKQTEEKDEAKEMAMYAERKKLMERNENFIMQINELRQEKIQVQNMLKVKAAEAERLAEVGNKVLRLEAEMTKKDEALMALTQQLKIEKVKNFDVMERFKALEIAYKHSLANPQWIVERQEEPQKQIVTSKLDVGSGNPTQIQLEKKEEPSEELLALEKEQLESPLDPLSATGIALLGTIKTILEGASPMKQKLKSGTKENIEKVEKGKRSPERSARNSQQKESLNKSQIQQAASPETKNVNADYERMKQAFEAERAKNAQLESELQRKLKHK